jgi:hypothetical protein
MTDKQPDALRREYRASMPPEVLHMWAADALACIASLEAQLEAIGAGGISPLIAGAGFDAADMATAAAQGFRDGVASVSAGPDDIDAIALTRYKVVRSHDSMFHRFAVVAGDGKQQLYLGRETECQNMTRKFAGAFLDGAFYQANITPSTQAAGSVPAVEREQERIAFKDAHRHLELYEVPDAWGRPMFKHSHVEASWLGWIARASHGQAPAGATEPTEQQILEAAEKAGLWPNTVHSWIPAFHRYHKELAQAQPSTTPQSDPLQPLVALQEKAGMYADDFAPQADSQPAPATQQAPQQPCPTCAALARTVMLDQVSFDRKPDCYGIRQITDDDGVEEWEDIRTSPDVAREEANDMMATGRGEIYEVVPLWTTPQPTQAQAGAVPLTDEQCDAIYEALDSFGREVDHYEFGLPYCASDGETLAKTEAREVIRQAAHGIEGGQHGAE